MTSTQFLAGRANLFYICSCQTGQRGRPCGPTDSTAITGSGAARTQHPSRHHREERSDVARHREERSDVARHREERSDVAIQGARPRSAVCRAAPRFNVGAGGPWIAASPFGLLARTAGSNSQAGGRRWAVGRQWAIPLPQGEDRPRSGQVRGRHADGRRSEPSSCRASPGGPLPKGEGGAGLGVTAGTEMPRKPLGSHVSGAEAPGSPLADPDCGQRAAETEADPADRAGPLAGRLPRGARR
ncbi:hypothetical protein DFR50_14052 [Roseiarcus fermentans]|uniref:Uncharacterized protein n=1 Tax=Roseiarcus fermentans TaxID=1473586 RepID=A0A366ERP9_9HYPH|nr:hypothetical protein DFR50_14052 [Roseiarcus fermentans]